MAGRTSRRQPERSDVLSQPAISKPGDAPTGLRVRLQTADGFHSGAGPERTRRVGSERPLPAGDHGPLIEPETHRPSPGPGHSRTDCVLRTPTSTGEGANRPFRGTSRDSQEPAPPRTNRQTPKSRTGGTIQPPSPRTPIRAGEPGEEPGIKTKSARKIGLKIRELYTMLHNWLFTRAASGA